MTCRSTHRAGSGARGRGPRPSRRRRGCRRAGLVRSRTALTPRPSRTRATAKVRKASVPWTTPQPADPNSHSPRKTVVPMMSRIAASRTRPTAAAIIPANLPLSRPMEPASSFARSTCALARPAAARPVLRSCSIRPGGFGFFVLAFGGGLGPAPGGGAALGPASWPGGALAPGPGSGAAPAVPAASVGSGVGSADPGG